MQVMCMGCKQSVEVDPPRTPVIQNLAVVSVIVVEHAEQHYCGNCKTPVALAIANLQGMQIVAVPLPAEAQKRLIVMPGVQ